MSQQKEIPDAEFKELIIGEYGPKIHEILEQVIFQNERIHSIDIQIRTLSEQIELSRNEMSIIQTLVSDTYRNKASENKDVVAKIDVLEKGIDTSSKILKGINDYRLLRESIWRVISIVSGAALLIVLMIYHFK